MAFCIQCGAPNDTHATFCVVCGQTLYHERTNQSSRKARGNRKWLIASCLLVLLAVLTVVWLTLRSDKADQVAEVVKVSPPPTEVVEAPVLMVIASNRNGVALSQGSGFILTSDGLAGTNYHVIKGAVQAIAKCCKERVFEIHSIEGVDLAKDLVVFQLYERGSTLKPHDLPHVALGSSKDVTVGQKVIAIGSPQGLENTVSDGILSAIREYNSIRYLQITAPISPGSSGGPVLNENGKMVGVATFQFEKGQNLNFAVDADHIRPLIEQHLGVSLADFQAVVGSVQTKNNRASRPETSSSSNPDEQPKVSSLTGQFGGVVHNQSVNASAGFWIIVQDDDGTLNGCMGVEAPLFGSGSLTGFVQGDNVNFIVTSSLFTITFTGLRSGASITGTYIVERKDVSDQQGTFTLQRANSKGPGSNFDTTNCPTDAETHK